MKSHDVAAIETTGLSIPHPSEEIRSGAGLTPRPHSRPGPGRRAPTCRGRFDALKCNRAFGCDANVAWSRPTSLDRAGPECPSRRIDASRWV